MFAGLVTNLFFGILRASVLIALYGAKKEVQGISIEGAITYAGLTQAVIGYLSFFSWYDLMNTIYTGAVATDLLKPMCYYQYWLAQDMGRAFAQLLTSGLTLIFAYSMFYKLYTPISIGGWLSFVVVLFMAGLVSFSWRFVINLSALWVPNAVGIIRFGFVIMWIFSGFLMPLRFFPDWFVRLSYITPFPYTINAVVEVYLGISNNFTIITIIFAQALWIAILIILGKIILRAGVRKLVILGG